MFDVYDVSLSSPRPEGDGRVYDAAHPPDWTVAKAHELARCFLPPEVRCDAPWVPNAVEVVTATACSSDALAAEVPEGLHAFVDAGPVRGRANSWLGLDGEGQVAATPPHEVVDAGG